MSGYQLYCHNVYDLFLKYLVIYHYFSISALLCIIIFFVFGAEAYISEPNIFPLVLLMMLYGWSSVPLMYPFSYVFSIPSSAFVTLSCVNLFIGKNLWSCDCLNWNVIMQEGWNQSCELLLLNCILFDNKLQTARLSSSWQFWNILLFRF